MYEATSTDFKPAEGEMPSAVSRFNLEDVKGQIRDYNDSTHDSMKIMLNGALVLGLGMFATIMFTSEKSKEEHQKSLEKQSEHVNLAVTTIDRSDIEEVNRSIDTAYIAETSAPTYTKLEPKMGQTERKLKKLVPKVDVMDPDEDSSSSSTM